MENLISIIIASYERPKLLEQTFKTLLKNTQSNYEVIVVDDFSQSIGLEAVFIAYEKLLNFKFFRYPFKAPIHTVKNKGFLMASPESKYLYFSDNDVYFEPSWDTKMIEVLEKKLNIGILGGSHHPHHQIDEREPFTSQENDPEEIIYSNEQPGYSMMIRRKDYLTFGPWFSDFPVGGEDSNLCMMARRAGFEIAAIEPKVVLHCGATGTTGNNAADFPEIMRMSLGRKDVYVE